MIAVIDYGRGNLFSLISALKYLGINYKIIVKGEDLGLQFKKIILPGVGAFGDAMEQIKKKNFLGILKDNKKNNVPILGICLGMQLFATKSYEFLETNGFDFIPGEVKRLELDKLYNIPNMGWRKLISTDNYNNLKINFNYKMAYFVHSFGFFPKNNSHVVGKISLGSKRIPAIVKKDNVIGFQFHPEKSGKEGLDMLAWFLEDFS